MMQPQQQSSTDIFSSIFNAQFLNNLVMFIMMFAFMKVLTKMLEEPAIATSQVREKAAPKSVTTGAGLRENPDQSEKQAVYQELELEYIAGKMDNRSLGIALEAAGDITRELLGKQYADGAYIAEKLTKVERVVVEREFKAKLSEADDALATEAINGYAELEFITDFGHKAKSLVLSVARQDVDNSKLMAELMEKELKQDPRFRK